MIYTDIGSSCAIQHVIKQYISYKYEVNMSNLTVELQIL